ncbi:HK97 family phage prohead protease [Companilactobacillus mishanensis]|uniref:HK97 family phage prohead protease n=1 Tax=Companilactobacillus mishanensis TaxID=2486008 RepID=A0ABW9P3Z7_9LACO|nr:HK97 family phage prohead protease [Companilactobacillus mishanensis]MQS43978.1 HK97 family phage prohead protease [Companilactobacillus mishanensis]
MIVNKIKEIRVANNSDFKLEKRAESNGNNLSGYAIIFDQPSEDLGGFIEYVDRSALDGVDLSKVQLLYNHNWDNILARTDSGTLSLQVDDRGLFFNAQIPDTTLGNDVSENVRNGNLKGCSFGFTIRNDSWQNTTSDTAIRHITEIDDLFELSITPMPAYQETTVSKRSLDKFKQQEIKSLGSELELIKLRSKLYGY